MREPHNTILWWGPPHDGAMDALARGGLAVERVGAAADVHPAIGATRPAVLVIAASAFGDGESADPLTAVRAARSVDPRRHLPVVLFVEGAAPKDRRLAALRAGVDDIVESRSVDAEEFAARVQRALAVQARFEKLLAEGDELQKLSLTDALTQVGNHRFFQDRLKDEFRRAQRYDDPLALILVDLDHFKQVNDRFGHAAGDEVLQRVARALGKCVRETDVLARYGGEEFAILLPKTHLAGALTVAERIWRDVSALSFSALDGLKVTCSMGVSGFPNRSVLSAEQLFRTSDEALYRAKNEGRNKICLFQQLSLFGPPAPPSVRAG